jgi:hypothetical protein
VALARAKSYIYVGGLPPTTLRRSKMGLLDAHVRSPLSIPVVGPERRNATHTTSGLALFDWPRSVDRGAPTASRRLVSGRHGGMIWPTSIGAARDRAPGKGDYARRAIQSSALPRRAYGGRAGVRVKPEKARAELCHRSRCAPLVWCTARAVGVRNSKLRNPLLPVRNTGSKRSSHAVFGARQATRLLISCSTSS